MIEIEDDGRRRFGGTGKKVIYQGPREPVEVLTVDLVFQTCKGRRTRQVVCGGQGAPIEPQLEGRVMAETVGILAVRIARSDLLDALR